MEGKSTDWLRGPSGPTVCRCCFAEGCYKDISTEYFWMGKREVYSEMLTETFDLSIAFAQTSGPNSNSRLICEPCISRLRDASEFKRQVQECEKMFMQYLDPGRTVVDELQMEITQEPLEKEVKLEPVKLEKNHSDDDFDDRGGFEDMDEDDLDDQPLTKLASKVPKKESVDLLDLLDNAKAEKRKSSTKTKASPAKKAKTRKETPKATASKAKPEKKKKGSPDLKLKWKPKRKYNDHRDNAAIIIECSNVCPFRWKRGTFTCAFCPMSFGDFSGIREHALEHPNRVEAMRLARPLDNVKVEITGLRCELCLLHIKDVETLKEHLLQIHDKPISINHGIGVTPFLIEGKEFVCTHCGEHFELFSKLNTHMNHHYPNNICFQCGKAFSAAHRLKAHLVIHEASNSMQYKCSKCDDVFATRALKNSHMALAHGPEYRYRCPYCNDSFLRYADRAKHLKVAHDRKVEYPCHLCTAVFSMCNQRTKHIQQVHIRHKQFFCALCPYQFVTAAQLRNHMVKHVGERKYQCQVCKKSYARTKTLKEHMRIHNNDKRFVCQFCNNAYVQKCSLQSHMRTHHPNAEPLKKLRLPMPNVY
ncbi:zinc finger protein 254-like isoform X13 [Cydia splendana]|uniref:zinc finger protein 254-like isoform X13 n=1 Tax=Cydia splendana TaxID=1100963 RepID=UPI00300CEDFC